MKTTQDQFQEFKRYCYYWHERLGLGNYELEVGMKMFKDSNAETKVLHDCARICIDLSEDIENGSNDDLKKLALHEMLHGVLGTLTCFAGESRCDDLVNEEEHKVINHIIKAILT